MTLNYKDNERVWNPNYAAEICIENPWLKLEKKNQTEKLKEKKRSGVQLCEGMAC